MEYSFCLQFGRTCSFCKKAVVVSYKYDEEDGITDVIYKCEKVKNEHTELSTCEEFKCNRVGEYLKCATCKQGMKNFLENFKRDLEEDYTQRK